jgi:hypothetical protein
MLLLQVASPIIGASPDGMAVVMGIVVIIRGARP